MKKLILIISSFIICSLSYAQYGNNNHTINGDNNTVGVNGDVKVNAPYIMSSQELANLLQLVKDSISKNNIKSDTIQISVTSYSSGGNVEIQMGKYLTSKGYYIQQGGTLVGGVPFYGYVLKPSLPYGEFLCLILGMLPNQ